MYNPAFRHKEKAKKFCIVTAILLPFYEDNSEAELTPTLKLKKRVIREKYKRKIQEIYS